MDSLYKNYLNQSKKLSSPDRIETFLNHILRLFQDNYHYLEENPKIKERIVYSELTKYGLNSLNDFVELENGQLNTLNIKSKGLFYQWIEDFKDKSNINAFCDETNWSYWMQFKNGYLKRSDDFEKIYLSLDSGHIYRGVKELMEFISDNNIEHASKISSKQRTDGIVIRIRRDDKVGLEKILNFIKNNQYIQEGLNQLNPFLPSEGNVSHIPDNAESYNGFVAKYISEFVDKNINSKKISYPSFLHNLYNVGEDNTRGILVNHLEKLKKDYQKDILNNAIICTYKKCGYKQVEAALKQAINNNNYNYFTRYDIDDQNNHPINYREQLINNFKSEDLVNVIYQKLEKDNYALDQYTDKEVLSLYISNVIMKYQVDILDKAVLVTCQNHDVRWANQALQSYAKTGNHNGFSRFGAENKTNYRQLLRKYVNHEDAYRLSAMSLIEKGIDIGKLDMSEIIPTYVGIVGVTEIKSHNR